MTATELRPLIDYLQSLARRVADLDGGKRASECTFGLTVGVNGSHYFAAWTGLESTIGETPEVVIADLERIQRLRLDRLRVQAEDMGYELVEKSDAEMVVHGGES